MTSILGLPLSADLPNISPYSLATVVKAIDSDGDEVYAVLTSKGLTAMDLGGMAKFMGLFADEILKGQIHDSLNSD